MTAIEKELIAETLKEKFERDQEEKMRKRQMLEGGLVDDNGNPPVKRG